MKSTSLRWLYSLVFLFLVLTLGGCDFVGDVLEFGMWTVLIIIVIIVLIIYLIIRMFRKR